MRDSLLYTWRLRGDGYVVVIQGHDHAGVAFEFVVPPALLRANLTEQARWAMLVEAADTMRRQGIKAGTPPDILQAIADAVLPPELDVVLWDSDGAVHQRAADLPHELLEGGDDSLGQPGDRQH